MKNRILRADPTTLHVTVNVQRVSTVLRVGPVPSVPFGFSIKTAYDEFTWWSAKLAVFCQTRECLTLKAELSSSKESSSESQALRKLLHYSLSNFVLVVYSPLQKQSHVTA